jgi:hypothetical protein
VITAPLFVVPGLLGAARAAERVVVKTGRLIVPPDTISGELFGHSLDAQAGVVAVGAPGGGEAGTGQGYVVSAEGALLYVLENPEPVKHGAYKDDFGGSVLVLDADIFAVAAPGQQINGRYGEGCVYIFEEGLCTHTLVSPVPRFFASGFGSALAKTPAGNLLIGASRTGGIGLPMSAGEAYVVSRSNQPVLTLENPTPQSWDRFGYAVCCLGDRLVVGAPQLGVPGGSDGGRVYVFSSGGQLLLTITNPAPDGVGGDFGAALAPCGSGGLLVGAPGKAQGVTDAGTAYLFDLNGRLVHVFTNPAPGVFDGWGASVAGLPTGEMLVGGAGRDEVILFGPEGAERIGSLRGRSGDRFGASVRWLDASNFWIGAERQDAGGVVHRYQMGELRHPNATVLSCGASSVSDCGATLSWEMYDCSGVLIVGVEASNEPVAPTGGRFYSADARWGGGDALGAGYVLYRAEGNEVSVSGLNPNTEYVFNFYPYLASSSNILYQQAPAGSVSLRTASQIAMESFEEEPGSWAFSVDPERYCEPEEFDIWREVTAIIADEDKFLAGPAEGECFWGMCDLSNENGGGTDFHTLRFAPVDLSNFTNVTLNFRFYTDGYDRDKPEEIDTIRYSLMFDDGTVWTNYVELPGNTDMWVPVTLPIADTCSVLRLSLETRQNGNTEPGGWDAIRLTGWPVERRTAQGVPYTWFHEHGFQQPEKDALQDHDGDGHLTWQEYFTGTHPLDAQSVFRVVLSRTTAESSELVLSTLASGRMQVLVCTNLAENNWVMLGDPENYPVNGDPIRLQIPEQRAFYRLRIEPQPR